MRCLTILFILLPYLGIAQGVSGKVFGEDHSGKKEVLVGANIYWVGTQIGVSTDTEGFFSLGFPTGASQGTVVVSYVGFRSDTIEVSKGEKLDVVLAANVANEVVISERKETSFVSATSVIHTEKISSAELQKAACCNLSESFETNATVDVSFADAISGSKTIRMLGLDGTYSLLTVENIPTIRGLGSAYGLTFIPGPWIESIQLSKGVGSVVNGYESTTGQINIELLKPDKADRLYADAYANHMGRAELNLISAEKLNAKWSTLTAVQLGVLDAAPDNNNDGFLDMPNFRQLSGKHRWKYHSGRKFRSQFGVGYTYDDKRGGQDPASDLWSGYRMNVLNRRLDLFAKTGWVIPSVRRQSLGIIYNFSHHALDARFGQKQYAGTQDYFYLNAIFQTDLFGPQHTAKLGGSFTSDEYKESFDDDLNLNGYLLSRHELIPGAFAEYTYKPSEKLDLVLGQRLDLHNLFGAIYTPRLHVRWELKKDWVARFAGGRGFRYPNIFADNSRVFANSRKVMVNGEISPEIAWNTGASLTRRFRWKGRPGSLSLDYFNTQFQNQLVADLDEGAGFIEYENLEGKSYSQVIQADLSYEAAERLDVRVSYKMQDVQAELGGKQQRVPFVSQDQLLINMAYALSFNRWMFDLTAKRTGNARLPALLSDAQTQSPEFWTLNAQITKRFKSWDFYAGGENLTGFRQEGPIVSYQDPFSPSFDATNIWGPIYGTIIYVGVRYKIKEKTEE